MGDCGAPGDVNSNVLVARSTGDAQLDKAVWQWLSWDKVGERRPFSPAHPLSLRPCCPVPPCRSERSPGSGSCSRCSRGIAQLCGEGVAVPARHSPGRGWGIDGAILAPGTPPGIHLCRDR